MSVIITRPCQTCFFELDHSESPVICKKCGAEYKPQYEIGRESPPMSTERDSAAEYFLAALPPMEASWYMDRKAFKAGWDARNAEVQQMQSNYEAAVKGQSDFRLAFKESRAEVQRLKDLLNKVDDFLEQKVFCNFTQAKADILTKIRASTEGEK